MILQCHRAHESNIQKILWKRPGTADEYVIYSLVSTVLSDHDHKSQWSLYNLTITLVKNQRLEQKQACLLRDQRKLYSLTVLRHCVILSNLGLRMQEQCSLLYLAVIFSHFGSFFPSVPVALALLLPEDPATAAVVRAGAERSGAVPCVNSRS